MFKDEIGNNTLIYINVTKAVYILGDSAGTNDQDN